MPLGDTKNLGRTAPIELVDSKLSKKERNAMANISNSSNSVQPLIQHNIGDEKMEVD